MAAERKPLTLEDREDISRGLAKGLPNKDIAHSIKRDESVVSREIQRHGGRDGIPCLESRRGGPRVAYPPEGPQNRRRPRTSPARDERPDERLVAGADSGPPPLRATTGAKPTCPYRTKPSTPGSTRSRRASWHVPELSCAPAVSSGNPAAGRSRRARRLSGWSRSTTARPRSEGRQVPGHLEGDLIIGKGGKSAMGTLVERVSRFTILVAAPGRARRGIHQKAVFGAVKDLPGQMRKSLTWDQGTEMAQHAALTSMRTCRYISPMPIPRGSAEPTRTRTASSGNTSRRGQNFPATCSISGRLLIRLMTGPRSPEAGGARVG